MSIACDVHSHTLFSRHSYSTIEENVRAAAESGIELLGSTDHFSDMLFEAQTLRNFQFFLNYKTWPRTWHGVRLLRGCEADIVDADGNLFGHNVSVVRNITDQRPSEKTLKQRVFAECDYVIASVHDKSFTLDRTPAQNAQTYVNALEDPKVLILGHIGRSGVDFELDPVLEAARDLGKLIELNEATMASPTRKRAHERCRAIAVRAAELGCKISVGSDAHISERIGASQGVEALLAEVDFPPELNACRSAEAFLDAMASAGLAPVAPHGEF